MKKKLCEKEKKRILRIFCFWRLESLIWMKMIIRSILNHKTLWKAHIQFRSILFSVLILFYYIIFVLLYIITKKVCTFAACLPVFQIILIVLYLFTVCVSNFPFHFIACFILFFLKQIFCFYL